MTQTIFERIGGEPGVRALVDAFYDRMDAKRGYARLRALHPPDLAGSRDKLFWFLCGWMGGPDHFVERFGHPRLRARHLPFSIGDAERDEWLGCMREAMQVCALPDELCVALMPSLVQTADWMRNRQQ